MVSVTQLFLDEPLLTAMVMKFRMTEAIIPSTMGSAWKYRLHVDPSFWVVVTPCFVIDSCAFDRVMVNFFNMGGVDISWGMNGGIFISENEPYVSFHPLLSE